jgi:Sulfotransferase family
MPESQHREELETVKPTLLDRYSPPLEEELADALRRARASAQRLPDFFIVGHAKCGTTALYRMLDAHPRIYMPDLKETQFLSRASHYRAQPPEAGSGRRPRKRPRTLEAYVSLFEAAGPEQRAGEASTEYLRTPATASRIAELCPRARIIAIFREPASFLRSLHLQLLQIGIETEGDFARAIELEQERSAGRHIPNGCAWPPALLYSQHVRYAEQLREYHEHFPRDRVLVLIYDDFRSDNDAVVRQVMRFLEVDDSLEIQSTEANPTVRVRSRRGEELVHALSVGRGPLSRAVKSAVKTVVPRRVRREALQTVNRTVVDSAPRAPDEELMAELRGRFKGEVVAAGDYLERDLVGLWGYYDVR